jgi:tetratricopeptide (TPR) repeat protein
MRVDPLLALGLAAGLLISGSPGASAAPDPAAADAAFDEGDSARALALYDEILAANPDDVNALLRSGKLLSWDRQYEQALARYDRALAKEPGNPEVLLERGKVLLWSRRYDEAVMAFDRVLRVDPKEPWALCGTAQAYSWRGRGKDARPFYERALAAEPGMKEALLGLAYVDLEDGDSGKALERSNALKVRYPEDPEVAELEKAVRRARASWVQVGWDGANDSDDNRMNTYRAEGGFALPSRMDLRFGFAHSDLGGPTPSDPGADGAASSLYGVLGWQPRAGHRGELRLGAMRLTDDAGGERTVGIGGLSYQFPIAAWTGRAAAARDPFLYSPRILDNAIDVTSLTFGAAGMVSPHLRVEANVGYGDFSDGNSRFSADGGLWYVWRWPKRSLSAGGVVRYLDFSEDLDNGYFDPQQLIAAVLSVRSDGSIGSSPWTYEAAVDAGAQSFTHDGAKASGEPLWDLYGLVARPLTHGLSFQIFATFGNSSTASGPGFTSLSGGVRLRYAIGG